MGLVIQKLKVSSCEYRIQIETGNRVGSGTDAKVSIVLTGTKGDTKPFELDKRLNDDFEVGQKDEYTLKARDCGELLVIKLINDSTGLFSDWFVNRVIIKKLLPGAIQEVYHFPFFRWVTSEVVLFEGKASLADAKQHETLQERRMVEIQQRQELFQWGDDPAYSVDLPGFIRAKDPASLPKDVQFTKEASKTLQRTKHQALTNLGLGKFFSLFESWKDFDDYRKCFTVFVGDVPAVAACWSDDAWFGAQFMNGCNPGTIKRCATLPSHFPVTDQLVCGLLDEGMTLKQAIKSSRLYMVDYKILEDIPHYGENDPEVERRYTSASMGLFYVRNNGDLVPIAIQLHQEPSDTNPIWTPNDSKYDWIYAKMWLRNADSQWHQMITHLLRCHLMMEPIAVATWRQLPSPHPVWKILFPHMKGVLAINTLGRLKLISKGGVSDQVLSIGGGGHVTLMQKYYREITWEHYDLPKMLKDRGVDDPEKLPRFYYRDDALSLWNAIFKFVKEMLAVYYSSDGKVCEDQELQAWSLDLNENGYPARNGSVAKGFPVSFTTREQLIRFITMVIFTCSCQHAVVNFSQMDTYGFIPNTPALLRKPPPVKKGRVNLKDIMDALASKHQSCVYIAILHNLTQIYPTEKFLGDFSESLFTDGEALAAISKFQINLRRISASIEERNKNLDIPYTYLLPKRIPGSIAI